MTNTTFAENALDSAPATKEELPITYKPEVQMIDISFERTKSGKLVIYFKSKEFEDFIRNITSEKSCLIDNESKAFQRSDKPGWKGHKFYPIPSHRGLEYLNLVGEDLYRNYPNLSFLRAQGLSEGKTFEFEGLYTKDVLVKWLKEVRQHVLGIYKNHIQRIECRIHCTYQEVDTFDPIV